MRRIHWRDKPYSFCEKINCPCRHVAEIDHPRTWYTANPNSSDHIKKGDELCLTGSPYLRKERNEHGMVTACDISASRLK